MNHEVVPHILFLMCTCERRYILHEIRNVPKFMKCYALTTLNLSKLASCSGMRSWQIPYTHQIKARPCSPFFTSSPLEFKMGSQQSQFRALWALWISTADDDNLNPRLHYSGNFRQNSHKYLCSFFFNLHILLKKASKRENIICFYSRSCLCWFTTN